MLSVTMSQIAEEAGIGRATLYKYFPDVKAILVAWHERQIGAHLVRLVDARDRADGALARLDSVLRVYALILHEIRRHGGSDLASFLHGDTHLVRPEAELHALVADLIEHAAASGEVRSDVGAEELARYCLRALGAARDARSNAAVDRLVSITLTGLRPATD